jgi:predicted nucleic acid-binding protein
VSVFVDTSALYALLVRTEEGHPEISSAFGSLLDLNRRLVTSNYVMVETAALLQRRFGLAAVHDLQSRIVPLLTIRWIGEVRHRRAMERLLRTDRRRLSLVDCSSFDIMDADGIAEALALDRDFEAAGYRVVPE